MSTWVWIVLAVVIITAVVKAIMLSKSERNGETFSAPTPSSNSISTVSTTVTELGPVNYFANDSHNNSDKWFQFQYKKVGNEWLTYILKMPGLRGRDPNLHLTHRYRNGNTYWICRDPQPTTLRDAQNVSRVWADSIMEYIATGKTF